MTPLCLLTLRAFGESGGASVGGERPNDRVAQQVRGRKDQPSGVDLERIGDQLKRVLRIGSPKLFYGRDRGLGRADSPRQFRPVQPLRLAPLGDEVATERGCLFYTCGQCFGNLPAMFIDVTRK